MNKISDFSSVLEIAFGLNMLFYVFELLPRAEERLKRLNEKHNELKREKIRVTKNSEVFPISFVIGSAHGAYRLIFICLSAFISALILATMLVGSFNPDARISTFWISSLLGTAYCIPLIAFWFHRKNEKLACAVNEDLEHQIRRSEFVTPR